MPRLRHILSVCYRQLWNRQTLLFLFFLALATSFWLFQKMTEVHEEEMHVPIAVHGQMRGLAITCDVPSEISVTLRDRGTTLLSYYTVNRFDTLRIDLAAYPMKAGRIVVSRAALLHLLAAQLDRSTTVQSLRPDSLEIFYNHGDTRRIPVRLATDEWTLPSDMALTGVDLKQTSVEVAVSEAVSDTISAAYLLPELSPTLRGDTTCLVPIQPVRGVKFTPSAVEATFHVEQVSSRTISVPVRQVNFPAGKRLRAFPATVPVQFEAPASRLAAYQPTDFLILVTYDEILRNRSTRLHLQLRAVPEDVRRAQLLQPDVEYLIEDTSADE